MSVWQQKTADIQNKINEIYGDLMRGNGLGLVITDLLAKNSVQNLITTGGLENSQMNEQIIKNATKILQRIEDEIVAPLQKRLKDESKNLDITSLLGKTGQLQQEIMNLRDQLKLAKEDADNQSTRDAALRSADVAVSKHQLFLFGRPIHKESLPYLWMSSAILFLMGFAAILLMSPSAASAASVSAPQQNIFGIGAAMARARDTATSLFSQNVYGPTLTEQALSIFSNAWVIGMTIFSLLVVIIVLALKTMGRLG
jgi:hypothetical protein